MTLKKRSFSRHSFTRFAVSYCVLILLVMVLFFAYMFISVNNQIRTEAVNDQIDRLSHIAYRNEEYMATMQKTADQIDLSPFIDPFVYSEHPDRAYDLMQQLSAYSVTNTFCEKMFLCVSLDDHVYSSLNTMPLDTLCSLMHFESVTSSELSGLLHHPGQLTILPEQTVESVLLDGMKTPIITIVYPFGSPGGTKGSLTFMIRKEVYQELFNSRVATNNSTYILQNGKTIVSSDNYGIPDDVVTEAYQTGNSIFRWNNEEWLLTVFCRNDMEYLSVLRSGGLSETFRESFRNVILLFLLCALVGFPAAYFLAWHNWKPVREISGMFGDQKTDGDDWQLIKTGINELSASNTVLSDRLANSMPMIRHDFSIHFLKNHYQSREEIIRAAQRCGENIDHAYYAVVLSSAQETNNQPLDLHREPFAEMTEVTAWGIELIAMNVNLYLLFSDRTDIIDQMTEMICNENRLRNAQAVTAVSSIRTDFTEAAEAYLEAATAYENRFVMDDEHPLRYTDISMNMADCLPRAERITQGIGQALMLNDPGLLDNRIDELTGFLRGTNMSPFFFRLFYNHVIGTLISEVPDLASAEKDGRPFYDTLSLTGCSSLDELSELLRSLCAYVLNKKRGTEQNERSDNGMRAVAEYIRDHFTDKELSISAISETFNMPMARLSMEFKEDMKMTPLEYLTMLRVEKSCEMLDNTSLPVKEIAEQVGYYDASSFIRRFRQKTGQTPMQYRHRKEGCQE